MYDVAVLVERTLEPLDADQLVALHEGLDDQVTYHLLRPVESTAGLLAGSLGAIGADTVPPVEVDTVREVEAELVEQARRSIDSSVALLQERGAQATGHLTEDDPVGALADLVGSSRSSEAIILTESHVVQEFLHVDWASRAKRRLDVPTLHLLEHVPFAGQV